MTATRAQPGTPLVLTKVHAPTPRGLVPRPALVERLASGPPRRLTVVRAPAGWGKTTLLSAWAASPAEDRPFAWLQLDASDSRPQRFWRFVVEALRTVEPAVGDDVLGLLGAPGVDLEAEALPVLLNALTDLDSSLVLVLDDYHLVDEAAVHSGLAFFVERLPPGVEVVVASREEPPLPLGRWRARGELLEVDESHLRFSIREGASLLNDVGELALDGDQVAKLVARTEGWAAGLYLAALSLREHPDPNSFVTAFSGDDRHVVDYLATEVLNGLQADVRAFLLRTSILDRLSGPLCDAVAGTTRAARLLREIERSNLFLVPLDGRRQLYRYHHLFGDLLRSELELSEPESVPDLHRRAAGWYLAADDADRAIRHTVAAGDLEAAVALIAEHWSWWLLGRGEHGAIDAWLRALPPGTVEADPRLCVARVFTDHSLGRARDATRWVDHAEAGVTEATPSRIRGDVATARASNALQTGDLARAASAAVRAIEMSDPASPWSPLPHGVRAHGLRWSGDAEAARAAFEEWLRASADRGQVLGVVCSEAAIALIDAEAGRHDTAVDRADRALELAAEGFAEHWVTLDAHVTRAVVAAARGDAGEASVEAQRARDLAARGGPPGDRANALVQAARILRAPELLDQAGAVLGGCRDPGSMVVERLATARAAMARAAPAPEPGDELSDREVAVLRLMASPLSQREIARELYVSFNTVKTHARHIFRKLGASSREDAVSRARARGLLP